MKDEVQSLLDESGASALLKENERNPAEMPSRIPLPDSTGLVYDQGTEASPEALIAERAEFEAAASQPHEPTPVPRVLVPEPAPLTVVDAPKPVESPRTDLGDDLSDDEGPDADLDVLLATTLREVPAARLETMTLNTLEWLGRQVPRIIRTWYRKRLFGGIGLSMTACKPSVQAAVDAAVIAVRDDLDFIQGHVRLLLTLHRTWAASALGQQIIMAAAIAEFCRIARLGETAETPPV